MSFPKYKTYDDSRGRGSVFEWTKKAKKLVQLIAQNGDLSENLYVLGLNSTPTATELRKAFFQAAFKTHPDRGGNHEDFLKVQRAYEEICKHI